MPAKAGSQGKCPLSVHMDSGRSTQGELPLDPRDFRSPCCFTTVQDVSPQPDSVGGRVGVRRTGNDRKGNAHHMPRKIKPMTARAPERLKYNPTGKGNKVFDGGGLFLLALPTGTKSWR